MPDYSSERYGLKLQIPEGWRIFESEELGGLQVLPPDIGEEAVKSGNLSILVRPQPELPPEDPALLNYIGSEIVRSNFNTYDQLILHSLRHSAIGQRSARELIFSYNDTKHTANMQALQLVTLYNKNLYLVTYTASAARFSANLHSVAEIVSSVLFDQ